jgi:hypothetical protein
MSLVVAGRRRVYVLLLFRERLGAYRVPLQRSRRIGWALGASATGRPQPESDAARVLLAARIHRRWSHHLLGLSFFVLAFDG